MQLSLVGEDSTLFCITISGRGQGDAFGEIVVINRTALVPDLYVFNVTAEDSGLQPLSSSLQIMVRVEHALPSFISFPSGGYEFSVVENSTSGSTVGLVSVEQLTPALDGLVQYQIVSGSEGMFFDIDSSTGLITIQEEVDREIHPEFNITVVAFSFMEPSLASVNTSVHIRVLDVNDNPPKFSQDSYSLVLPVANMSANYSLLQLSATDPDVGSNSVLIYTLENVMPANYSTAFSIVDDGMIVTTINLSAGRYLLNVSVEDMGIPVLKSFVSVVILVQLPVPDQLEFTQPAGYTFNVSENIPSGAMVGRVILEQVPGYVVEYISFTSPSIDFFVVSSTGIITTLNSFDREEENSYTFSIQARMHITSSVTTLPPADIWASVNVTVYITDMNDNPPTFVDILPDELRVPENRPDRQMLHRFNASDADSGSNQELEFSILNQDVADSFHLNSSTGELYAAASLDREQQERYPLVVRVSDMGSPSMCADRVVQVVVDDVNDNAPALSVRVYDIEVGNSRSIFIEEYSSVGTVVANVSATDLDAGNNSKVQLSLIGEDSTPFSITISDGGQGDAFGEIVVANRTVLVPDLYVFNITAEDSGLQPLSSSLQVMVRVEHTLPDFISFPLGGYEFSVAENSTGGSTVGLVTVEQLTPALDGLIQYQIVSGNEGMFFNIDSSTGLITIQEAVDRETHPEFNIIVVAFSYVEPSLASVNTSVLIRVEDVNDNVPKFSQDLFSLVLPVANVSANASLLDLQVSDLDSGYNSQLSLSVVMVTPVTSYDAFIITDEGTLITTRNVSAGRYLLNVSVQDMGMPVLQSFASIVIVVQLPVPEVLLFTQPTGYSFFVAENSPSGFVIGQVSVTMIPDYVQEFISFFSFSSYFIVNETTGDVLTLDTFDFETRQSYEFSIIARMNIESRVPPIDIETSVNVTVVVEDVNDCRPEFERFPSNLLVLENRPAEELLYHIIATDCDSGVNQQLQYQILNSDLHGIIFINDSTGELYVAAGIDREVQESYTVVVQVKDLGIPTMSITSMITLSLIDVNDNAPALYLDRAPSTPSYSLVILTTNISTNTSLLQVLSHDVDSGRNAEVEYSIELLSPPLYPSPFSITNDGTILTTATDIGAAAYHFNVTGKDMGIPSLESYILITILVQEPVPDLLQFTRPGGYFFTIEENIPSGYIIGQIALEPVPHYVEPYVNFASGSSYFFVSRTGEIETLSLFDREEQQSFMFEVNASLIITTRVPPVDIHTSVEIRVHIIDTNDNLPVFVDLPSNVSILENRTSEEFVYLMEASDSDSGINQQFKFTILNVDVLGKFHVNALTGELYAAAGLDREQQEIYSIVLEVNDLGSPSLSSDGVITVILEDINDNAPILLIAVEDERIRNTTIIVISEDIENGATVANITAIDYDAGDNSEVNLSIAAEDSVPFGIYFNSISQGITSGEIIVANKSRLVPDLYIFDVVAKDSGLPPLNSSMQVMVRVEHALPDFISFPVREYVFRVTENSSRISFVGIVSVEQMTPALDGLVYSIVEGNEERLFGISPSTGVISTKQVLDRETYPEFNMTISAFLPRDPSLGYPVVSVIVLVEDVNDNAPVFSQDSYFQAILSTNLSTTATILQVAATDVDSGMNAQLLFSVDLTSPRYTMNPFHITPDGHIFTTTPFLNATTYLLNVTAQDMGTPILQSFASALILVQLLVPESIRFTQPGGYRFQVRERSPSGRNIGQVQLTMIPEYVQEYLSFYGSTTNFRVVQSTGDIQTLDSFDYEHTQEYKFEVSCELVIPTRVPPVNVRASVNVTVLIEDVNDNPPVFLNLPSSLSISENNTIEEFLYLVNATDIDSGVNQQLEYHILNLDLQDKFHLNSSTGDLYVFPGLDREQQDIYVIVIQVNDLGTPRMSATDTLTITLTDINDNAPILYLDRAPSTPSYSLVILTTEIFTNTSLLQVLTTDIDSGRNAQVQYSIELLLPLLSPSPFVIRDDGRVFATTTNLSATSYHLKVVGRDMGVPSLESYILIAILIQLPVPERIQFSLPNGYALNVSENIPAGFILGQITLEQVPDYVEGYITFTSTSSNFMVNSTTGEVSTLNMFDHEEQQIFIFQVQARMLIITRVPPVDIVTSVNVTVYIDDINDNTPVFVDIPSILTTLENRTFEELLYQINATDADSGLNQQLQFSIQNQDLFNKFYINASSGELYAATSLDREVQDTYLVVVRVSDLGTPSQYSERTVTIMLEDINDNAPMLMIQVGDTDVPTGSTIIIDDETEPDEIIANLTAMDHDIGINADVYFEVDSSDGLPLDIRVSGSEQSFTFGELVVSNASSILTGTYTVIIHATNVGSSLAVSSSIFITVKYALPDEISFTQSAYYEFSIIERSPTGTIVGNVSVEQVTPALDDLQYAIIDGNQEGIFEIDPARGDISLQLEVDREIHTHFNLTVVAFLPLEPFLHPAQSTVLITVNDINDNAPIFVPRDYSFTLSITDISTNSSLIHVMATDADDGSNAEISYSIRSVSPLAQLTNFSITEDGRVFTDTTDLDLTTYLFNITAWDMGMPRLSSTQLVLITVQLPEPVSVRFSQLQYQFTINENAPLLSVVGQVTVESPVLQYIHPYIRYSVSDRNFGTNSLSGEILAFNTLDYERIQYYLFEVSARVFIPNNVPTIDIETSANVSVMINDENDNAPQFTNFPSNLTQLENRSSSELLYVFDATDADSGINQRLYYEILNLDLIDKFSINNSSGELYSAPGLDRETQELYYIIVQVSDMGYPRNTAQGTVVFTLLDVNDNVPRLINGFEISVQERTQPRLLFQWIAVDQDLDQNGMVEFYQIQTLVSGTLERIDTGDETRIVNVSQAGELFLYRELDYEVAQWYSIHIRLTDLGNPPLQSVYTNITLLVIDQPDNSPQFEENGFYQINLFPVLRSGQTLVQVHAQDADPGDIISYAIESIHHEGGGMGINIGIDIMSGRIYSTIDQFLNPEDNFTITVLGFDNSPFDLVARATVRIHVLPERLQFSLPAYSAEVSEDAPMNTEIIRIPLEYLSFSSHVRYSVDVTQPVAKGNAFTFSGNGDPAVTIFLNDELDREEYDEYIILVTALRGNDTAQTTLLINVTDVNDNVPLFVDQNFESTISELTAIGTVVHKVNVTDADIGNNSIILFEISGSFPSSPLPFSVDSDTGYIMVADYLDYEDVTMYMITITATDYGIPPLQASQNYTVIIVNENDNFPLFAAPAYFGEVYARAPCNVYVHHIQLFVTDDDDIANEQQLTFTIFYPVSPRSRELSRYVFEVTPRPPYYVKVISLPEEADLEPRLLELRVQVTDEGGLSSHVPLYISVFTTNNLLSFELSGVRRDALLSCRNVTNSICGFRMALGIAAEMYFGRLVSFYNNSLQFAELDSTV